MKIQKKLPAAQKLLIAAATFTVTFLLLHYWLSGVFVTWASFAVLKLAVTLSHLKFGAMIALLKLKASEASLIGLWKAFQVLPTNQQLSYWLAHSTPVVWHIYAWGIHLKHALMHFLWHGALAWLDVKLIAMIALVKVYAVSIAVNLLNFFPRVIMMPSLQAFLATVAAVLCWNAFPVKSSVTVTNL